MSCSIARLSLMLLFADAEPFPPPSNDFSRWGPWLFAAMAAAALLLATVLYVHRLNRSHGRLLANLQNELAERRRVEDALRASEGFYHSLVESLPQSILRKDLEGRFTFGNQRFCHALRMAPEEIVGKTDFDFFPAALAEKYRSDDRQVIASGKVFETVEEHVTPQGEKLYVHVIKTPLRDPAGTICGVQGIFWDVTERKRAEEQLVTQNIRLQEMARSEHQAHVELKQAHSRMVQSEKLASLGQMVAGVAHEINNPVAFVSNNVAVLERDVGEMRDLLAMYAEADELLKRERADLLERIDAFRDRVDMAYTLENIKGLIDRSRDGLSRIQQIVGHLRLFARLDEGQVNDADINGGIESTAAIIRNLARKKQVQLELDLGELPEVTCYAAKLNQVMMNLLTNAIDACREGGTVTVRTRAEDQGVRIEVADNGCGIAPEHRDRIFDPFFTTKPVGQGTGLGLSISYGIIQDHGATIEVDSTVGQGTCFTIHLPLRPNPVPKDGRGQDRPVPGPDGPPREPPAHPEAAAAPSTAEVRNHPGGNSDPGRSPGPGTGVG
jgi:PAS domain S-box-containing protein